MQPRRITLIFTGLVLAVTSVLGAGPAGAGSVDCSYVNLLSEKVVDIFGGSMEDGAPAVQWTPHDGANQLFGLEFMGDSPIGPVVRFHNVLSGKVLDVEGGSTANGAKVIQWTPHGGTNQQWIEVATGQEGVHVYVNVNSSKVLDIDHGSLEDGAHVIQWDLHGGLNQLFAPVNCA